MVGRHSKTLEFIRSEIGDHSVYLIAEGTTDVQLCYILIILLLVGRLNGRPSKSMQLMSKKT